MGATAIMPYRALSYIRSALVVTEKFPDSQLQIVHANHVGNKVNGVDLAVANEQAHDLAEAAQRHIQNQFPHLRDRVLHAIDLPMYTDGYVDYFAELLQLHPELGKIFKQKSKTHSGDALRYLSAHVAYQDTDDVELAGLLRHSPDQIRPAYVISIGSAQERLFYKARMLAQDDVIPTVSTAQLFTQHSTPPYYVARGGEPSLHEGARLETIDFVDDIAARRDIAHFLAKSLERNPLYGNRHVGDSSRMRGCFDIPKPTID